MPYVQYSWVDGASPASATNMNHLESQFAEAMTSLNADVVTPYVLSGYTPTKDGVTASQLDVTSGVAYLLAADGHNDLTRVANGATTYTASGATATWYLDLNPDGSWSWATSHSAVANYLTIATVVTDASGNISTVTDTRNVNTTLFSGMAGTLTTPPLLITAQNNSSETAYFYDDGGVQLDIFPSANTMGTALGGVNQFGNRFVGIVVNAAQTVSILKPVSNVAGQATAGSFGVPVIVAQASRVHVTATTAQTIMTYTIPADGEYELIWSLFINCGAQSTPTLYATYTDPSPGPNAAYAAGIDDNGNVRMLYSGTTNPATYIAGQREANLLPATINANAGTLTVTYQNSAGTPSDYVSVTIVRLS